LTSWIRQTLTHNPWRSRGKIDPKGPLGAIPPDSRAVPNPSMDENVVAARAYELWQERGCPIGSDQEDWFQAEREFKDRTKATATPLLAQDARLNRSFSRRGWLSDCNGNPIALLMRMKQITLTIPEIAFIGGTRVALGAGIGLLISRKLNKDQRMGAGWALFAVGVLTTVPILLGIVRQRAATEKAG